MKKLIALLLVLACAFALVACGGEPTPDPEPECEHVDADGNGKCDKCGKDMGTPVDPADTRTDLEKVADMYEASMPTKAVTKTTQQLGTTKLEGSAVLTIGTIDGKTAATYVRTTQELAPVSSESHIVTKTDKYEYIQGMGVRTNGGAWDAENRYGFISYAGYIAINLNKDLIKSSTYEDHTLTLQVEKANVAEVLKEQLGKQTIPADAQITITDAGGKISGIKIEYTIEANEVNPNDTVVVIETVYSYDLEEITIG